jgi:serine/threonine protein phosphatase PrpC
MKRFQFRSAGLSHVGMVRQWNQDAWLDRSDIGLWVVADGMGGHASGDAASLSIVEEFSRLGPAEDARALLELVEQAADAAQRRLRGIRAGDSVGTTLAALLIHEEGFAVVWAGDSRIYLLRGGILKQLTHDHSLVQELIDRGTIGVDEARIHPLRSRITRAVASDMPLALDRVQGEVRSGDLFLLCSDGLTEHLRDSEITEVLAGAPPNQAVQRLVGATLDAGASDNVTVVVVTVEDDSDRTHPLAQAAPGVRR